MRSDAPPITRNQLIAVFIVFFVGMVLRSVNLDAPLIGIHSYRQADTAGIARNFYRDGIDVARPRIDWGGATSGVVGETEMPIFNAAIAMAYGVTGPDLRVARGLAAAGSAVTVLAFFWLVRRWTGDNRLAVLSAAIWFLLPYNIYFTRAIMPESWMLATTVLGTLLFDMWAESPKRVWAFVSSAVVIALAGLIKLPALHIGLLLGAILWWRQPSWRTWLRLAPALVLYAVIALVPSVLWVVHSNNLGAETGLTFGLGEKLGHWRPLFTWEFYNKVVFQHISEKLLTWAGLPLAIIGGVVAWRRGASGRIVLVWCAAVLVFFLLSAGPLQPHEYYKLPLILPASILIAFAINAGWNSPDGGRRVITVALTLALVILAFGRLPRIWRQEDAEGSSELALARAFATHSDQDDLVVVVDASGSRSPVILYLADRKGWLCVGTDTDPVTGLDSYFEQGAVLVGLRREVFVQPHDREWLDAMIGTHEVVFDGDDVLLVK